MCGVFDMGMDIEPFNGNVSQFLLFFVLNDTSFKV